MSICLGLGVILLIPIYYFIQRQITRRKEGEILLKQQTEREKLVSEIAQHIRQSLDLEEVLVTTVADVKEFLQADRVLIYRLWKDGTGSAITETVSAEYPTILGETFPEEVFPTAYHQAYTLGKIRAITDINQEDVETCLADFVKQFGVKSKLVVPILQQNRDNSGGSGSPHLWGLLIAHQCRFPRHWESWEIELMKQLATQVAIAIQQSELYKQLQELNIQLEDRVQKRTEELAKTNDSLRMENEVRKRTEEALRRSEERFRSLIENALDLIMIIDYDGRIFYASPSVEKVLGYPLAQFVGCNFFTSIHPDDLQRTCYRITHAIENSEMARSIEFRYRHQDGHWCILEAISQRFLDDLMSPRIVVNSRDITERKRLEEVHLAWEKEKELNSLKTRFFSMASHEFRTPLSTALAAAQLLENSVNTWNDSEKRLRNLRRIQNAVKNMVQILDDILMINRAEAGKLEFNPQLLDLESFCRQFLEEVQLSDSSQHPIIFVLEGKKDLAFVDEKLLRSILSNLLSNAIKYSPQGGEIKILLKFEETQLRLEISDQGIGILPEDQKQLFEPFHRGKNVRNIPGTGLGLIVTRKCVDLHRGDLSLKSCPEEGTTMIITLPLRGLVDS